ncbi:MAG: helix-turn-helix domain-containing protein [Ferruginibacter sp.]
MRLQYISVDMGIIEIQERLTHEEREQLNKNLQIYGLELMDKKKVIITERVKNIIVEMIHHLDKLPAVNYSYHISKKLNYNYTYLSNIFSEVTGVTIQQFMIAHKIERVKELLMYNELNLTEISYKLNYRSVAHVSRQFKKVTGISVSCFKSLSCQKRTALENL